jgi:hypothetical protein
MRMVARRGESSTVVVEGRGSVAEHETPSTRVSQLLALELTTETAQSLLCPLSPARCETCMFHLI